MTDADFCDECQTLRIYIHNSLGILIEYSWLLNSFVLDFYTENHWKKLPEKWKNILDEIEPDELGKFLDPSNIKGSLQRVWPLSFLALRSACVLLSVSRQPCQHDKFLLEHFEKCSIFPYHKRKRSASLCVLHEVNQLKDSNHITSQPFIKVPLNHKHPDLAYAFSKNVKLKKRHEISSMAQVTAETAAASGCQYVVDIGSGLGHLARLLAYSYGLKVCCLEAQDTLSEQARKLDVMLETSLSKHLSSKEMGELHRPVHVNMTIGSQLDSCSFVKEIQKAFKDISENEINFGIVGLHPCGNLGPILLQLFVCCPSVKFVNIVGCCYMKMSLGKQISSSFKGYPLSKFVSKRPHRIDYEACEIACHAIECYCRRLCSGDINHLKIHCYRATLEQFLVKHCPELRHTGIRSIKHSHCVSFDEYCTAALAKLGMQLSSKELNCQEIQGNLAQWKRVVMLYSLRLMLAPLVETVVLLDRLLYLHERGISSALIPVFDPSVSPRNHILVGIKASYM